MAPHSRTLAWKIPWTEEPGGLRSTGSLRVGHDWATSLSLFPFMHWGRKRQPTPGLVPGKSHGRRNLVGCSPPGCWGSDTTERFHFHFSLSCIGKGNGNPLQCSCLENPRDGGAWWAAVYGVAQSWTRLKQGSSSSSSSTYLGTKLGYCFFFVAFLGQLGNHGGSVTAVGFNADRVSIFDSWLSHFSLPSLSSVAFLIPSFLPDLLVGIWVQFRAFPSPLFIPVVMSVWLTDSYFAQSITFFSICYYLYIFWYLGIYIWYLYILILKLSQNWPVLAPSSWLLCPLTPP